MGYGAAGAFAIMEIYASATGTWTVIVTDVTGMSCIVAAGEGWETTIASNLPDT